MEDEEEDEDGEEEDTSLLQGVRGPMPPTSKWRPAFARGPEGRGDPRARAARQLESGDQPGHLRVPRGGEAFVVVGTAKNQRSTRAHPGASSVCACWSDACAAAQTPLEDVPQAICEHQGRLLVGSGRRCVRPRKRNSCARRKSQFSVGHHGHPVSSDRVFVSDLGVDRLRQVPPGRELARYLRGRPTPRLTTAMPARPRPCAARTSSTTSSSCGSRARLGRPGQPYR